MSIDYKRSKNKHARCTCGHTQWWHWWISDGQTARPPCQYDHCDCGKYVPKNKTLARALNYAEGYPMNWLGS